MNFCLNKTTNISIIDQNGNAVSMTTSIEMAFGSTLMVRGFLLNNQLTDFSFRKEKDDDDIDKEAGKGAKKSSKKLSKFLLKTCRFLRIRAFIRVLNFLFKILIINLIYHLKFVAGSYFYHTR